MTHALTPDIEASHAGQISTAVIAQTLQRQSTLVVSTEHFWTVIGVAAVALRASTGQKTSK
jgi:hypothetical protein